MENQVQQLDFEEKVPKSGQVQQPDQLLYFTHFAFSEKWKTKSSNLIFRKKCQNQVRSSNLTNSKTLLILHFEKWKTKSSNLKKSAKIRSGPATDQLLYFTHFAFSEKWKTKSSHFQEKVPKSGQVQQPDQL